MADLEVPQSLAAPEASGDISKMVPLALSKPDEAAKNIDNSQIYGMDPSTYKEYAPELNDHVDQMAKPTQTTPNVARYMAQSTEHTSLALPDNDHLSYMERQAKLIGDYVFDRPTTAQKIIDLSNKKMNSPDKFTDDDAFNLLQLNQQNSQLTQQNYGLDGPIEKLPAQIAGVGRSMVDQVKAGFETASKLGSRSLGISIAAFGYGRLKQMYDSQTGSTYNELSNMTDDKGQPLNIDESTKKNVARGVGIVSTGLQEAMNYAAIKASPLVSKFINPYLAKTIVNSPVNAALMKTVSTIGEQYAVGFVGAGAQETTRVLGEEIAKHYDGTDESILNALTSVAANIDTHGPRILKAGAEGGLIQGAISAAHGVLGFGATKSRFQTAAEIINDTRAANARDVTPQAPKQLNAAVEPAQASAAPESGPQLPGGNNPVAQAEKVMHLSLAMENIEQASQRTEMAKLSPGQLSQLTQKIYEGSGLKRLYIATQDLKNSIKDPARLEAVKRIIDPSGTAVENAPYAIEPHKFQELQRDFPETKDLMRIEPDGPTPIQAQEYLKNLEAAHEVRTKVLSELGAMPNLKGAAEEVTNKALVPIMGVGDVQAGIDWHGDTLLQTPEDYLGTNTFTKAIESVVSDSEIEKFNSAQLRARKDVHAAITDSANKEMLQVQDLELENALDVQKEIETQRLANNPNFALVDKFRRDVVANSKGKQAVSIYAIDPKYLSDDLLPLVDSERLKEHGVFAKGGTTPDEAAQMLGQPDGRTLLETLAKTPTREEVIAARVSAHEADLAQQVKDSVDLNESALVKAFNDQTKLHIEEMKFMREKEWPAAKSGIKRIALPLPKIAELNYKARATIAQTKVGDLNVNQYKVGERRSQREAINAILKNEVERAFMNKENAALNVEMQKESAIAIAKVNRGLRFARRFNKPEVMQELKDAGPSFEKAANDILDTFNLNPSKKGSAVQGSYQKWVKKMYESGQGDFSINPELSDIRQSVNEMTSEAAILVTDRLRALLHEAKTKNRLYSQAEKAQAEMTVEQVVANSHELLIQHPSYDEDRLPSVQEPAAYEKARAVFATALSTQTALKHIALTLDQEKPLGFFYKTIVEPLTGEGEFKNKQGFSGDIEDRIALVKHLEKNIEALGVKEYRDLQNTWLDIPEFKGNDLILNKTEKITKADLMMMMAHMGDPDGRKNLEKLGVTLDTLQKVFERELDHRHAEFVTNFIHEVPKSYIGRTARLQKETSGQEVTFIQGVPFEFKGRSYPGGYVRQRYRVDFDAEQIKNTEQALLDKQAALYGDKDNAYYARQYAAEMTDQGRLEERTGSKRPLDISFGQMMRNFEEIIHDLNYRKPIIDALKLLKEPTMKKDIVATVGVEKYRVMTNSVIELANQIEEQNKNYFADSTRFFKDLTGHTRSGFSISRIGGNLTSFFVQPVSVPAATLPKMGMINGSKHMLNVVRKIIQNPLNYEAMAHFAAELETSIRSEHQEIADSITSTFHENLPSKNLSPKLAPLARARDAVANVSMGIIQVADTTMKTLVTLASYEQFMAGDVEGFSYEQVQAMSSKERHEHASRYAAQISETTLTRGHEVLDKSPFQKNSSMWFLSWFMNDARQVFNGMLAQGRKINWESAKAYDAFREGDYSKAKGAGYNAAASIITLFVTATIARIMEDAVRGYATPLDYGKQFRLNTFDGQKDAAEAFGKYIVTAPFDILATVTPAVREVHYAADVNPANARKAVKNVTTPIDAVMTAAATTYHTLSDMLSMDRTKPTEQELKQMLYAGSYLMVPVPVNGAMKLKKYYDSTTAPKMDVQLKSPAQDLHEEIKKYKEDPPKGASADFLKQLDQLDMKLQPEKAAVSPETFAIMKKIESGGSWSKVNPENGAAGVYQFTEGRWKDIMTKAPELGLTDNGRVSKKSDQQEKAAQWEAENNASQLQKKNLPVDAETLFAAHAFGPSKAISLYQEAADTKLKAIFKIGDFSGRSDFANFKTVGQVRKYIKNQVSANRLTLADQKTED